MPAGLRVKLSLEEDRELLEIGQNEKTPKRTKQRAEVIRMSGYGRKVAEIAEYFECHPQTIREAIQKWREQGKEGLYDLPKTGRPKQWQEQDLEYLQEFLEKDKRVYNSQQLSQKLKQERKVQLSGDRIRKLLKKKDGYGNEREFRTETNKTLNSRQSNRLI